MLDEILDAFASAFKEKYDKNRTGKNWPDSNKQGNICVNLLRKTKQKKYFINLNIKNLSDGEKLWNNIRCSRLEVLKKESLAQVFSCEFCEIPRTPFFTEHFHWLLL